MPLSKSSKLMRKSTLALAILVLAMLLAPSAKRNPGSGPITPSGANLLAIYAADAVTLDRTAREYKILDQVEWQGRGDAQTATLFGDPSKPEMYVQLLKRVPNNWSQPHTHPNDRYLTVLKGTMLVGTGAKFDPKNTVALGPGSVIKDFANQVHYDGSGPDGLILEIIGVGPATMTPAAAK